MTSIRFRVELDLDGFILILGFKFFFCQPLLKWQTFRDFLRIFLIR